MPRQNDDLARRRLRGLYENDRRRTLAVANARDRNRRGGDRDEERAPRRFVVSERRTRQAGFGRGGMQVRSNRRRNDNRERRFEDRSIFRRGNRDRFERDDDIDRRRRRDRRDNNRNNNNNSGRRFAVRDRRGGRGNNRRDQRQRKEGGRNLDTELDRYKRGGNGKDNNRNSKRGARNAPVSKEDLDAQLENFRTALTPAAAPTI